jgi:hypothetical protein
MLGLSLPFSLPLFLLLVGISPSFVAAAHVMVKVESEKLQLPYVATFGPVHTAVPVLGVPNAPAAAEALAFAPVKVLGDVVSRKIGEGARKGHSTRTTTAAATTAAAIEVGLDLKGTMCGSCGGE